MIHPQMSVYLFVFLISLFSQHSLERSAAHLPAYRLVQYERIKMTKRVVGIYLMAHF